MPSWILLKADRHRQLLIGGAVIIFLLGFNGQWQIERDSALYLSLGRNLARGSGYTYHGVAHNLSYPGMPVALAAMFKVFGSHAVAACDALILLTGFAAMGLMYRLFSLACGRPTAVVVTLLTVLAHEYFRYCYEVMPEIPFLAGVLAVLAGYEAIFLANVPARWTDWGIFVIGSFIVIYTKPMMMPLMGLCAVCALWTMAQRKPKANALIATAIIAALILLFALTDPRHPLASGDSYEHIAARQLTRLPRRVHQDVRSNVVDFLCNALPRAVLGMQLWRWVGALVSLATIAGTVFLWHHRPLWAMWVAAIVLKVTLLHSHDRYLVPVLPFLVLGWWRAIVFSLRLAPTALGNPLFVFLLGLTIIANLIGDGISIIEQHRRPFAAHFRRGSFQAIEHMSREAAAQTANDDILLTPAKTSRIFTFLCDRVALEPGEPMVDLTGHRLFVILPVGDQAPAEQNWLARLGVTCQGRPIVVIDHPCAHGGSLALYPARLDGVKAH